ncbi:DUF6731 family protein [Lactobacillus amylovorus]|uniref:DUF6731 family protein n=1 Tax=Lactobacillus amylovorus TaxID=1604 RepID=UPI003F900090
MEEQKIEKKVRFDFYQVYIRNDKGSTLFDLNDWVNLISNKKFEDRNIRYNGDIIRCDQAEVVSAEKNPLTFFHFTKLRTSTAPAVASLNLPELNDVTLKSDEYIAEDISGLFDDTNKVVMLQRNIYSLSVKAIETYISYFWQHSGEDRENEIIEFRPIIRRDAYKKIMGSNKYKSIIIRTANLKNKPFPSIFKSSFSDAIDAMKNYEGATIEVRIKAKRKKDDFLNSDEIQKSIKEINNNNSLFSKATVTVEDNNHVRDVIDLIAGQLHIYMSFLIPKKAYLDPAAVQQRMLEKYSINYDDKYKNTVDKNLI